MEVCKNKPDIREKALEYGLDYPVDEELVMLILGNGTKDIPVERLARKIVETMDSSNEDEIIQDLIKLKGVGLSKAMAIAAALELGRRRSSHFGKKISSPSDIVPYVQNYGMSEREHFLLITLNGGLNIIKIHVVSVGAMNRTIIRPRDVFREAIKENAAAVIFCHNHPSGRLDPSSDDIETTRVLIEAANLLGISALDHIILNYDGYFSFLDHNLLFESE